MLYRFVIEKMLTAQVSSHADIAARLLDHLVKRKRHYDESILPALRTMTEAPPPDRGLEGAWNATADQLLAASEDLLQLMADARQQGVPALQARTGRSAGQKLDLTLAPPTSATPREIAATLYVMNDGLKRAARDASDELGRLVAWLGACDDPAAQDFVEQMKALASQLRPANVAPGPHAPSNVEVEGPPGHVALMKHYEVHVVAGFGPDVDLLADVLDVLPSDPAGQPSLGPQSKDVDVVVPATGDDERPSLRATFAARGQNPDEAEQYALSLFDRARAQLGLPEPSGLTVDARES